MIVKFVEYREVNVYDLKPHPQNPNQGSVNDIAESLDEFGQYRSVVALPDLTLLAGHHVVQAAKNTGIKTIRVEIIDTDPQTAQKIMLADNRIPELGPGNDLEMLLKNLEDLAGDLAGTGYDDDYVKLLEEAVNGSDGEKEEEKKGGIPEGFARVSLLLEERQADRWESHRKMFPDDAAAFGYLLD